jgi:hypothetical protein
VLRFQNRYRYIDSTVSSIYVELIDLIYVYIHGAKTTLLTGMGKNTVKGAYMIKGKVIPVQAVEALRVAGG